MTCLMIADTQNVRILTMNRPERHNALNTELTQRLLDALVAADSDPEVNSIVLTGAGKSFCAGADTAEFSELVPQNPVAVQERANLTMHLHLVFSRISKPVVAGVRGYALGGGAGLALACDLVVMAEDVRFGYPEMKHGILPAIVMSNLVRQLGRKDAFELVSMGDLIDGKRARELRLANRVCAAEQVHEEAFSMALKLAQWNTNALRATKTLFHRVADQTLASGLEIGRDANIMMRAYPKQ